MLINNSNINSKEKWRATRYSSIFTRRNFNKILNNDLVLFDEVIKDYDDIISPKSIATYKDYINQIFHYLTLYYRNEYIIKNALLNNLIKRYGTNNTIALNEFSVGDSIADIALFNGHSKVFEIKTEYDNPKRLASQISDYKQIFQYCYLVVHTNDMIKYINEVDLNIGIITYNIRRGRFYFEEQRKAEQNSNINPYLLMRCLHTNEYKKIVQLFYGSLPAMNAFTAFKICEQLISNIPSQKLHQLFIKTIKQRKNNMKYLKSYDYCLRQICLSMHLTPQEYNIINSRLLTTVNI